MVIAELCEVAQMWALIRQSWCPWTLDSRGYRGRRRRVESAMGGGVEGKRDQVLQHLVENVVLVNKRYGTSHEPRARERVERASDIVLMLRVHE